ncbi:hypothetical protein [Algibacter sp. 2305UL17-15]|uniref:hypothetical protein n=1 Tax=Algibacter sp. 2305UL17-15 TaxID=3231268 RepID=UPI0034597684
MAITILTKALLPAFIYLIDSIKDNEEFIDYTKIADEGVKEKQSIDPISIKRAFELREQLKQKKSSKKTHKPSVKTLNALTTYFFRERESSTTFEKFITKNRDDIKEYYIDNKPTDSIIEEIFKKSPPKINHLQKQEDTLYALLNELNGISLQDFVKFWVDESLRENKKEKDLSRIKSELKSYIDNRINVIVKKKRKASFLYRFFGGLSLFFVSVDYREITQDTIFEDFLEDYDILETDEVLDDLV